MTMEQPPFEDVFPTENGDFHKSHVSFRFFVHPKLPYGVSRNVALALPAVQRNHGGQDRRYLTGSHHLQQQMTSAPDQIYER